jgi:dTMP kinase
LPELNLAELTGKLIVIEGTDGVGRSTQINLLKPWLEQLGRAVLDTGLSRSELAGRGIKQAKEGHTLGPITLSLFYATDFADRFDRQILPMLKGGYLVLCDRYVYTSYARDRVRGCSPLWLEELYRFARQPDIVFYFKLPLATALGRILEGRTRLKYHEAGMDLGLASDPTESFRIFQGKVMEQYDRMADEFGFTVIDATRRIPDQQEIVRSFLLDRIDLAKFKGKVTR